jgi:hypothetical protein
MEGIMDDLKLPERRSELLDHITFFSKEGQGVHYQDFERVFRESAREDITVDGWRKITGFTSDQLGFWEAKWLFSWAYSPDTGAKSEMDGWKIICEACLGELKNKLSEAADMIEEQYDLAVLKYSLKRAVDYNDAKPTRKFKATVRSSLLIKLDKVGFRDVASRLYRRALYPKGTVGRERLTQAAA